MFSPWTETDKQSTWVESHSFRFSNYVQVRYFLAIMYKLLDKQQITEHTPNRSMLSWNLVFIFFQTSLKRNVFNIDVRPEPFPLGPSLCKPNVHAQLFMEMRIPYYEKKFTEAFLSILQLAGRL